MFKRGLGGRESPVSVMVSSTWGRLIKAYHDVVARAVDRGQYPMAVFELAADPRRLRGRRLKSVAVPDKFDPDEEPGPPHLPDELAGGRGPERLDSVPQVLPGRLGVLHEPLVDHHVQHREPGSATDGVSAYKTSAPPPKKKSATRAPW